MTKYVIKIGVRQIMRSGQLAALLVVLAEARITLDFPWGKTGNLAENPDGFGIVVALVVLLALSELVRVGRLTSISSLVWLGYIARFTGLGWAGTGFVALLSVWLIPGANGGAAPLVLFWAAGGLALTTSFYAFSTGRTRIVVRKFKIAQNRATPATGAVDWQFDVRITVLSDLHLGEFVTAAHIRRAVEISNNETPDMVLLLGDYVEDDGSLGGELVAELTRLEAKLGVFAVLGNHDIRCCDSQLLIDELERDQTVSLLRNSSAFVEVSAGEETKTVQIIGIESPGDWWYQDSDVFGKDVLHSELSTGAADFTIVASHHPEAFGPSAERSVDLVVAGHTHGGQLAVPFTGRLLNVGRLATKYLCGLYESGTTTLVVSAGIGVGIIPARIGVPPEVTLIEISFD
ncbi:MAG: metallophosphoesterase [Chloroflexi bacterium]|nr:metallophosphoesterase [Chloroflexota bacterium]